MIIINQQLINKGRYLIKPTSFDRTIIKHERQNYEQRVYYHISFLKTFILIMLKMQAKQQTHHTQQPTHPKIYHSQLPTNNPKHSIYTIYQYATQQLYLHKLMLLPSNIAHLTQYIIIKRNQTFTHLSHIHKHYYPYPSTLFSQQLSVEPIKQSGQTFIKIKQPYYKGVNLAQLIVEFNHSTEKDSKQTFDFVQSLIARLINIFLRVKREALFIPTFRTIIYDKFPNEININLFSFAGTILKMQNASITQAELKEVLPFLDCSTFQEQQNWINLPRALAVIVLGILCGKEINLLTSKDKPARSKKQLEQLIRRNRQKFRKILNSKPIATVLLSFQKQKQINLKLFLWKVLVNEELISWSACLSCLSRTKQPQQSDLKKSFQEQKIKSELKKIANSIWRSLSTNQKMHYILNKILSISSASSPLEQQRDFELFLIVNKQLDFTLLSNNYSLAELISKSNDKTISSFNSKLTHIHLSLFKAEQDQLAQDQFYYGQQSTPSSQIDDNSMIDLLQLMDGKQDDNSMIDLLQHMDGKQQHKNHAKQKNNDQHDQQLDRTNEQAAQKEKKQEGKSSCPNEQTRLSHATEDVFKNNSNLKECHKMEQTIDRDKRDELWSHASLRTLLYQQQTHKFTHQNNNYKIQSPWLKTMRDYQKIIIE